MFIFLQSFENEYNKKPNIEHSFALANSDDYIKLYNGDTLIDLVAWGNAISGWSINADDGQSIQRKNFDDTDSINDWKIANTPEPNN